MTKHEGSRERIVDALLIVMSIRGADGLTIRTVAAQAGVSAGAVQHHFATKSTLIVAAMAAVNKRFRERLGERLGDVSSAEERLRVFCRELSCIENDDLTDAIVWTGFAARSSTDARVRAVHATSWAQTEVFTQQLLAAAFPDVDIAANDAALLLAVLDGIAVARAAEQTERMSPARAEALIEGALRGIRRGSSSPNP